MHRGPDARGRSKPAVCLMNQVRPRNLSDEDMLKIYLHMREIEIKRDENANQQAHDMFFV